MAALRLHDNRRWCRLLEGLLEVRLHLLLVLQSHLSHSLDVGKNLPLLVDLFNVLFTLRLNLVDAPVQLVDQVLDLLLIGLLLKQLSLDDNLALAQLADIFLNFSNLLADLNVRFVDLYSLPVAELVRTVELLDLLFGSLVPVLDLPSLLLHVVHLRLQFLDDALNRFLLADLLIDEVLLRRRDGLLTVDYVLRHDLAFCLALRSPAVHECL